MKEYRVAVIEKKGKERFGPLHALLASSEFEDMSVYDTACTLDEAYGLFSKDGFDIVFLDMDIDRQNIQLFLERLSSSDLLLDKELIIVSEDTAMAFEAYRVSATDYLLKPLMERDVYGALQKARNNIWSRDARMEHYKPLSVVAIPSLSDVKILNVVDIAYLQSDGRYTMFHKINGDIVVSCKNLGHYEKKLSHNNFFRIHHSYLVNVDCALHIYKKDGTYLEIADKKYLPISKRKADAFYKFLGL